MRTDFRCARLTQLAPITQLNVASKTATVSENSSNVFCHLQEKAFAAEQDRLFLEFLAEDVTSHDLSRTIHLFACVVLNEEVASAPSGSTGCF